MAEWRELEWREDGMEITWAPGGCDIVLSLGRDIVASRWGESRPCLCAGSLPSLASARLSGREGWIWRVEVATLGSGMMRLRREGLAMLEWRDPFMWLLPLR